ncbi:MAG: DcaP family trimeric outer membrane transporter [Rikenellaceae bacterium]
MKRILVLVFAVVMIFAVSAEESNIGKMDVKRGEAVVLDDVQPAAVITAQGGKYSISISGNINMKASYDFDGSIDSPDFIPSSISVPGTYDSQRRFYMDATTSRVELKGAAHTDEFGDVELCLNMDFRGGSVGSYMPRVRLAYITVGGFSAGRNFTTFCDMGSIAPNIDFQGSNSCPFIYTTQVRYVKPILDDRFILGGAIEYLDYQSSSLGDDATFQYQEKYLPDVIGYIQYNWGDQVDSHTRLTGLYKNIALYNTALEKDVNLNGWGTQLSGSIEMCKYLKLYYSGTCGEGITNYMQDLYGSGLDATVTSGTDAEARMTFMYGWQAAALAQLTDATMVSAGYSEVNINGSESRFAASDYRKGEYLFANIFYSLSPRIQLATEFLWGKRTNNDGASNHANRINTMIQYNF